MMVQVEELEGKFAEFDEFIIQLAEKREEIYAAKPLIESSTALSLAFRILNLLTKSTVTLPAI